MNQNCQQRIMPLTVTNFKRVLITKQPTNTIANSTEHWITQTTLILTPELPAHHTNTLLQGSKQLLVKNKFIFATQKTCGFHC